jgi:putative transposase
MQYRRAFIPGGSFFFTLVTQGRRPIFTFNETVAVLRNAFKTVRASRPFEIDAIVIMPEHLYCIWTLPPNDANFATRWRLIKTWFTKHADPLLRAPIDSARSHKSEQAIWQHRYWEHCLRDENDYLRHVEYIHYNPVKHGHAASPLAWPYSSFHRYVEAGTYTADWGQNHLEFEGIGHE